MSKLKLALALLGAFSAGGGLGVLLTKSYFEKRYSEEADKAISEARATLIKRMHTDTSEGVDAPQKALKRDLEGVSEVESPTALKEESFDEFGRQKAAPDFDASGYSKYHKVSPDGDKPSLEDLARKHIVPQPNDDGSEFGYDQEDPNFTEDFTQSENQAFEEDAPRIDGGERDPDPHGRAPYEITENEYLYGDRSFSKVCLTYYEKDKVLTDEDGSPVNIDNFVGRKAIARLRDEQAVFVRNERMGCDFEVDTFNAWYSEPGEDEDE